MNKAYIVMKKGYEYDDNIYNETDGGTPKTVCFSKEDAIRKVKELNVNEYQVSSITEFSYEYEDCVNVEWDVFDSFNKSLIEKYGKIPTKYNWDNTENRLHPLANEDEINEYLLPTDLILDGGQALVGVESTIIDCTQSAPAILRPGAITEQMIEESTGLLVEQTFDETIRVSGSLENHYSPKAHVVLGAMAEAGEGFIALASITTPKGAIRLASPKSNEDYARVLYLALREADSQGLAKIAVIEP